MVSGTPSALEDVIKKPPIIYLGGDYSEGGVCLLLLLCLLKLLLEYLEFLNLQMRARFDPISVGLRLCSPAGLPDNVLTPRAAAVTVFGAARARTFKIRIMFLVNTKADCRLITYCRGHHAHRPLTKQNTYKLLKN